MSSNTWINYSIISIFSISHLSQLNLGYFQLHISTQIKDVTIRGNISCILTNKNILIHVNRLCFVSVVSVSFKTNMLIRLTLYALLIFFTGSLSYFYIMSKFFPLQHPVLYFILALILRYRVFLTHKTSTSMCMIRSKFTCHLIY